MGLPVELRVDRRELATAAAAREHVDALAESFVAMAQLDVASRQAVQPVYESPQN